MEIRPIKTESDYEKALARIAALMGAKLNSPEGDELLQVQLEKCPPSRRGQSLPTRFVLLYG
jgi:antitoxin component HigA of HigAB toxin-antitoxin module